MNASQKPEIDYSDPGSIWRHTVANRIRTLPAPPELLAAVEADHGLLARGGAERQPKGGHGDPTAHAALAGNRLPSTERARSVSTAYRTLTIAVAEMAHITATPRGGNLGDWAVVVDLARAIPTDAIRGTRTRYLATSAAAAVVDVLIVAHAAGWPRAASDYESGLSSDTGERGCVSHRRIGEWATANRKGGLCDQCHRLTELGGEMPPMDLLRTIEDAGGSRTPRARRAITAWATSPKKRRKKKR